MEATARTLSPAAPLLSKKGPSEPSLPAAMVTTVPVSTMREAMVAQASVDQPPAPPMLAVMMSAC